MRPLDVFVPKDTECTRPLYEMLEETILANTYRKQGDLSVVFTQATLVNSGEILLRSLVIPPDVGNQIAALIKAYMRDARVELSPLVSTVNAFYVEAVERGETFARVVPETATPIDPVAVALLDSYRPIFFPEKGFRP